MAIHAHIGQPGLFVVRRPLLTLLILLGALALVGFNNGSLLSPQVKEQAIAQLSLLGAASLIVSILCIVPAVAPNGAWPRAMLSFGLLIAASILAVFGSGGEGQGLTQAQVGLLLFMGVAVAALIQISPLTGRVFPVAGLLAVPCSLIGVLTVTAWVTRTGAGVNDDLLLLLSLAIAVSVIAGMGFTAGLVSRESEYGIGSRLAVALSFNNLTRDLVFGVLVIGLFAAVYLSSDTSDSLFDKMWLIVSVMLLICLPALTFVATAFSLKGQADWKLRGWQGVQDRARNLFRELLRPAKPSVLAAGLAIALILSAAVLVETPAERLIGTAMGLQLSAVMVLAVFYSLIFLLSAISYASLRMGVVVALTFMLGDFMTAGMMTVMSSSDGQASALQDIVPRFLVLLLLVSVARQWADILHNRHIQRYQITSTFARAAAPVMLGALGCLLFFVSLGLLSESLATDMLYVSQRFSFQLLLSVLLLPAAMSVIAGLKARF